MTATFRAMNTDVSVVSPHLSELDEWLLARTVAAVFEDSERRFSRFRPDSELSRLNRCEGPFSASPILFAALERASGYVSLTDGLFDPTIGEALAAAGYDRSFAPGALDRDEAPRGVGVGERFRGVLLDPVAGTVLRPPSAQIDFGGFVKGWTADQAARLLPATSALDAGGDAVLLGDGPDGRGWLVEVEDPFDPRRVLLTLRVRGRAVATSAPNRRQWQRGGVAQHHLVDPRTGRPSTSDLAQATVVAACAERADVLAKTVFLLGEAEGRRFLERMDDAAGVLVTAAGAVRVVGNLEVVHDA